MINELIKIANALDKRRLRKEADYLDRIIKTAQRPWYQNMVKQEDGSLAAIKIYDIPGGQQKIIVFADSDGNPPTSEHSTPDGAQYTYGTGESAVVGKIECKSDHSGDLPEDSAYSMICYVRHP